MDVNLKRHLQNTTKIDGKTSSRELNQAHATWIPPLAAHTLAHRCGKLLANSVQRARDATQKGFGDDVSVALSLRARRKIRLGLPPKRWRQQPLLRSHSGMRGPRSRRASALWIPPQVDILMGKAATSGHTRLATAITTRPNHNIYILLCFCFCAGAPRRKCRRRMAARPKAMALRATCRG